MISLKGLTLKVSLEIDKVSYRRNIFSPTALQRIVFNLQERDIDNNFAVDNILQFNVSVTFYYTLFVCFLVCIIM